ncbi:MAG: 2,3,4,5-tetrahydropyridine-2,6-dicarboxylate N-succinyltransferase [Cellvibrionales bacterium TMED122]|nr:2,3,4,5-tetrahydropyridine-2,6-dicarboxylate N-succinyltransferase [Halieaceae bacterium]OUV63705.1 MAG: 2,3,4,5-tetrahydropyridine-2,6-dicarboxylate N-succinyltransferase [Cellvibrionales bacterium TMED122]
MSALYGFGLGVVSTNTQDATLDAFYPRPLTHVNGEVAGVLEGVAGKLDVAQLKALASALARAGDTGLADLANKLIDTDQPVVATPLAHNAPPASVEEAYLKLHLISHRLVKPHQTDLTGIFGLLPNVAWTDEGPVDLQELSQRQLDARLKGSVLEVSSVDKFPKMTNYVVPTGVRIAHTARVRLGAYLGEGTTVMHEGFINFNAGTEGPGMIEGRISAGVWVGEGSDLGGGCSTMGTLSGGGNIVISVGKDCLIGANAGLGIPLGDRCTIEAGLFVTAGTKVSVLDEQGNTIETVSARALAGRADLLFRRHSSTGTVQCLTNKSAVELNEMLHANN